jgi:hypothetical protein
MTKASLMVATCATLLWAGTARATPTAQQNCDNARITAWKVYTSCIDSVVAKDAKGVAFDEFAAFAKCRHAYFKKWTAFQAKASLAGSTCIGSRFTDNGDQTVTDNLSGLVWEKKDNLDGMVNGADPHDADNTYTWTTGAPYAENGTAFSSFLTTGLNTPGFAGANGWRLPTVAELQTILLDFACTGAGESPTCRCPSSGSPCIDPALDVANTQSFNYGSATSYVAFPAFAWLVSGGGQVYFNGTSNFYVRAVRGGL